MIYMRLAGGLGNQLYQIAAASLVAHVTSLPVIPLLQGLSSYEEPRSPDYIDLLQSLQWLKSPSSQVPLIWHCLALKLRAGRWLPSIGVSDRNFWETVTAARGANYVLDGYFQHGWSTETFSLAKEQMSVRPISDAAAQRISADEVIIHVRGGDFLRLPQFQVVDTDFYVRASLQAMERGFNRFAIMSDDKFYASAICEKMRRHLPNTEVRLISRGASTLEDFDTLRAAAARIIGNSTFAWWAAALADKQSPTWSATHMKVNEARTFFLPFEIPISILK